MGRKKKKQVKPWCWYCNREFDDEKILIQHQKSKHFKCTFCHKKLYTGPGLSIHSMQVHKEKIDKIPYALPHRCNVDLEIYGMEGIPDEDTKEHERHKSGKEDVVEEKKIKLEHHQALPPFPINGLPFPPGFAFMPPMSLPMMPPPLQFGLAPPVFVSRTMAGLLPNTMPRIIGPNFIPPPQHPFSSTLAYNCQEGNKISENDNIPPPPPPSPPIDVEVNISQIPTFPAYSASADTSKVISKVTKPTSSAPNVKVVLVHPEDDIPLEQIRLRLTKYSSFLNPIYKDQTNDLSWTKFNYLSSNQNDPRIIPPPPPPGFLSIQQSSQFERATHPGQWMSPHMIHMERPLHFGGPGF